MGDARADGFEDRLDAVEGVFGASDHDAESAFSCAFAASGDGGVEEGDVPFGEGLAEALGLGGADGAEVDDGGAGAKGFGEAIFAEEDGFDVGGVADADEDSVGGLGEGLQGGGDGEA